MNEESKAIARRGVTGTDDATMTKVDHGAELQTSAETARALAEIQSAMVMAKRFPRDLDLCADKLMALCRRPSFARKAYYSFKRAQRAIAGPSVWLTRQAASKYGNIRSGFRVLRNDGENVLVEGFAFDLETNAMFSEQAEFPFLIQRAIWEDGQKVDTEWIKPDMRDGRELINKHGAICERNAQSRVLPVDYVNDAYELCIETVAKGEGDQVARVKKARVLFAEFGVEPEHVQQWLCKYRDVENAPLKSLTSEEFAALVGVYNAIKDGSSNVNEHFELKAPKSNNDDDEEPKPKAKKPKAKKPNAKAGKSNDHQGHDNAPTGAEPPDNSERQTLIDEIIQMSMERMKTSKGAWKLIGTCGGGNDIKELMKKATDVLGDVYSKVKAECDG